MKKEVDTAKGKLEFDIEQIQKETMCLINSDYEYFFKKMEKECERKYIPSVLIGIYEWLLTGILENGVFQDFWSLTSPKAKEIRMRYAAPGYKEKSYKESMNDYERKKKKLDKLLNKYSEKYLVLPDNVTIEDFLRMKNEIKKEMTEIFSNKMNDNKLTGLQHHLNENDFVLDDGRTVNKSLKDIACEVVEYNNKPVTWQYLQKNFLKRNGEKFSKGACENARDFANA